MITNLSVLRVILFLFGVPHCESSWGAAAGLVNPCCTSGQRSRMGSHLSSWDALCSPGTSSSSYSA